jgi:hypothetical protein
MMKKPIKTAMPKMVSESKKVMKPLTGKLPATKLSASTSTGNGKRIVN